METRLGEDRANIIYNAVHNDPSFFMSDAWCIEHNVTRDECEVFLKYALDMARNVDWKAANLTIGAESVMLTFTKHSGKVGQDEEQWTVFAPTSDTQRILRVAETGQVEAQLFPKQMPIDFGDEFAVVSTETGELLA